MVIDTSALVAILNDEPERRRFNEAIELDEVRLISAATLLESPLVLESRRGEHGGRELDLFPHPPDNAMPISRRPPWVAYSDSPNSLSSIPLTCLRNCGISSMAVVHRICQSKSK
jgi:hypothetical protein